MVCIDSVPKLIFPIAKSERQARGLTAHHSPCGPHSRNAPRCTAALASKLFGSRKEPSDNPQADAVVRAMK